MQSKLKLGIVGAGYIANVIADAAQQVDGITIAAVASRRRTNAETLAVKYKDVSVFNSWEELTASAEVDAVYVAAPTAARAEICLAAAQSKKHVLAEKPFVSLDSLQRITTACQANRVAFMDATHFPHHPRTGQLKREREARIGDIHTIHSCFYFPSARDGNIRFDPAQEPTGAIGDMAWYSMRALAEFIPQDAQPVNASGFALKDKETGALIQGSGVLQTSDGCTSTWDVGYNTGTCIMELRLIGHHGLISLDDFVLDWRHGFPIQSPAYDVGFIQRVGLVTPAGFVKVATPSQYPPTVYMLQKFSDLIAHPLGVDALASIRISEKTQQLLDAITANLNVRLLDCYTALGHKLRFF